MRVAATAGGRGYGCAVIRLRLSPGDLERLRFAYSPLAEVAESLYVLECGQIPVLHQAWFDKTRKRLRHVDMQVLRAIVPAPRPHVASFLLAGAREPDHDRRPVADGRQPRTGAVARRP